MRFNRLSATSGEARYDLAGRGHMHKGEYSAAVEAFKQRPQLGEIASKPFVGGHDFTDFSRIPDGIQSRWRCVQRWVVAQRPAGGPPLIELHQTHRIAIASHEDRD